MAVDMGEVVGQENMAPEAKETVLEKLMAVARVNVHEAKHAFMSWARQTGTETNYGDLIRLGLRKKRRP